MWLGIKYIFLLELILSTATGNWLEQISVCCKYSLIDGYRLI